MINQQILDQLHSDLNLGRVFYTSQISSTNQLAAEWLQADCPNLSLIVADEQTQGKGRSGRKWYTNPGSALAFTLVITNLELPIFLYNGLAAVAIAQALSHFTQDTIQIKWPNDILIVGRKVCGVLTESHWSGDHLLGIIIGIGINIFEESLKFEDNLPFPPTFLQQHTSRPLTRIAVLKQVLENLLAFHNSELTENLLNKWNQHLAYQNMQIRALRSEEESITGLLIGVSPKGQLKIQLPDSSIVEYNANEIQQIRSI